MTPKPANGWTVKEPVDGTWAAFPSDSSHPDWEDLFRYQDTLVHACDYTYLVGPLSDQPGEVAE